jgi:hypothetical protein
VASFTDEILLIETPIDIMFFMHKVFMAHAKKAELMASSSKTKEDIEQLKPVVDHWLKHITYHVDTEDEFLTGPLKEVELHDGRVVIRDNQNEHDEIRSGGKALATLLRKGESSGLDELLESLVFAAEEEQHKELVRNVDQLRAAVEEALGEEKTSKRTLRHLHQAILALRVIEWDHFENEEAFVLPLVREQMTHDEQLKCAGKLLLDDSADEERWVIEDIYEGLSQDERAKVKSLEEEILSMSFNG